MNTIVFDQVRDVIYQEYVGDQTAESLNQQVELVTTMINEQKKQGKRALLLTNVHQLGAVDMGAKKVALATLGVIPFDKLAIVGTTSALPFIMEAILTTLTQERVSIFENEADAVTWLHS